MTVSLPDANAADFDALASAAQAARQAGQGTVALGLYADMRRRFPERSEPLRLAADLLVETGGFDEADILLQTAQERFPSEAGIAIEYAWAAYRRRDLPEALQRWRLAREAFPDHPLGYTGAVVALRETGALAEADALLEVACGRFPNDPAPFIEQAWMALARQDPAAAVGRWETVRQRFPGHWLGYTGGAVALRDLQRLDEAEHLLADAVARFPEVYPVAAERAWLAAVRQDWAAALARWTPAIERFPEQVEPRIGQARALRELRRFDDARVALQQAMARFQDNAGLRLEQAMLAHDQADWAAAAALWAVLREQQPDELAGWRLGADAARHLGHAAEAAALLQEAERRSPDPAAGLIQLARQALHDRRWVEAVDLCDTLRQRHPDRIGGYLGGAAALRELRRLDEAAGLLDAAAQRFPEAGEVALGRGWLACAAGQWAAAVEGFAGCVTRLPDHAEPVVGLVRALCGAGRFADAMVALADGLRRLPGDPMLAAEQSTLLAARVAAEAAQHRPGLQLQAPRLIPVPEPGPDVQARDPVLRDFVMRFESLGGDRFGAEFGMVQRACGASPLGLLERADVSIEALCAMLEGRLAGVGGPENTELFVMTGGGALSEYGIRDRRGWFTMRAFISPATVDAETMLPAYCARLRFLAGSLAEALSQGRRMFVYRATTRALPHGELGRLRRAMRQYGPRNALLCVGEADAACPDGTVMQLDEGLLMGRVTAQSPAPTPDWLPPMEAWLMTLGNSWALREGP